MLLIAHKYSTKNDKVQHFVISIPSPRERKPLYSLFFRVQGIPLRLLTNRNDKKTISL